MPLPPNNPKLIEAALCGERRAWEEIFSIWGPVVLRWCSHRSGGLIDPEDAASEVFERVLTRLGGLKDRAAFPAWLHWQTRAVITRHRRRAWLKRWLPGAEPDAADPRPGPGRQAELSELSRLVEEALSRLSEDHREVLILVDLEGHSLEEAAALLGAPVGTIKSRLSRARERFQKIAERMKLAPDEVLTLEEPGGKISARS